MKWYNKLNGFFIACLFFSSFSSFAQSPGGVNSGLQIWLRADVGTSTTTNGTALSGWTDQSGVGRSPAQATGSLQPLFYNTSNLINFNPCVSFDGTDEMPFTNTTGLNVGNNNRVGFAVATAYNSPGSNQWIFSYGTQSNSQNFSLGQQGGTNKPFNGMWSSSYDVIQSGGQNFGTAPIIISGGYNSTNIFVNSNYRANTTINTTPNTVITGNGFIGRSAGGAVTERWNGAIAEVIDYNGNLTANQTSQICTYLAIKYGITLDATAANNYRSAVGTTVWSYTTNAGYNNDIAGVGRDDYGGTAGSGLNQKQSKSVNSGEILTIGLGSIDATNAANANAFGGSNRYFIWGNNGGSVGAWTSTETPSTCYTRIAREWKMQETGTIGNMLFRVPESGAATNLPSGINGTVYMLVDGDGDFTSGATAYVMTKVGTNWEVSRDLSSGDYITFATTTVTSTMSGTTSICQGTSTNLSIALTGPTPWSLTYTDGLTSTSVTGITTTPYTPSVKPYAASTTYTVSALTSGSCAAPNTGGTFGSTTINQNAYTSQVPTTNLQSRYKLNNNANDETGYNPGTLQNAPTATTDRFGITNTAYSFNGTNQYITTTNSYVSPTDFTLSLWFKTNTLTGGKLIGFGNSQTGSSGTFDRHIYMTNAGQIYFGVYPGSAKTINTTTVYNDNLWHMVTATFSSVNGMKLYMDGVLIVSDPTTTVAQNNTGYWRIAYDNTGSWPSAPSSQFFAGNMDDILIYSGELTAGQISTIYNGPDGASSSSPVCDNGTLNLFSPALTSATYAWSGPSSFTAGTQNTSVANMSSAKEGTYTLTVTQSGCTSTSYALGKISTALNPLTLQVTSGLQSYYKLNNNANDEQNVNVGTLQNTPTVTTDRFGVSNTAFTFNGSNQYISTAVPYTNPSTFTLSLWFKTNTSTGGKLIGFGNAQTGASGNFDRHIYMNNAGQLYFGVYTGSAKTINTTVAYNDNVWHMVTASLSPTNGIKLYVDGVLVSSDATTTSAQSFTGYWKIAYDATGSWPSVPSSPFFSGSIDDVFIYNSELTSTDINTLYISQDGLNSNNPCIGNILNLTAPTVAGTYSWAGPNSFVSTSQNPSINPYLPVNTGVYSVVVTVTATGCRSTSYVIGNYNASTPGLWTGYVNTSWATANNWCSGSRPTATTDVTIPSVTNLPTNSAVGATTRNLTINPSATLTNTSTGVISISGNLVNSGAMSNGGIYTSAGNIAFTGNTAQTVSGNSLVFNNLIINNTSGGVSLGTTTTVNGILTLTAGTLTTGGNLNQNLYTGAIAGTGSGSTSGNIRFFKTIWGDKYHYLSVPIGGMTAADWNDNVTIKFGAASNLYSYDESLPDTNKKVGWTPVASLATSLQSIRGYALYFPRWIYNTTLDVTGAYSHSATFNSGSLANTPSTTPIFKTTSDGWQLMGNPYPSDIDWDASTGWTKTGLNNAIYSYDNRTYKYASYVSSSGTNGGTRYIGSMQGFFVKVTSSGGTGILATTNSVRVTSILHDVWRTEKTGQLLRLQVAMGSDTDETVVRFIPDATEKFDDQLDAYKLLNEAKVPSLFSVSSDADYSINSLPDNLLTKTIPLQLNVMTSGQHIWTADLSDFKNGETFFLEDRLLQTFHSLNENPTYTTTLTTGEQQNRFFLHYSKRQSLIDENNNAAANGGITISAVQQNVFVLFSDLTSSTADIAIFDALGKKIYEQENTSINAGRADINLQGVNNGIYIVKVRTTGSARTQQVFIQK